MIMFLIGLFGFLAIHSVRAFAPGVRIRVIAKIGEMSWKGLFALFSLAFFVPLVMDYPQAQSSTIYFGTVPTALKHINAVLIPIALILAVAGSLPRGFIQKTLKHPQLVGVKLWALGHLLVNWDLTSFILFGSFLVWAVLVRISIKKRPLTEPKPPSALWDAIAVIIGGLLTGIFVMGAHVYMFGVAPIPIG
tara:strand:- start:183 stop:758 length:576 start_codon:yes stop_codon:yes gene_type:complete